jgi:hypothetical protein
MKKRLVGCGVLAVPFGSWTMGSDNGLVDLGWLVQAPNSGNLR